MWSRFLRHMGPCAMGSRLATRLPDSGSTAESLCSEARRELAQPPPQSVTLMLRPTAAGDTALMPTNGGGAVVAPGSCLRPKSASGTVLSGGLRGKQYGLRSYGFKTSWWRKQTAGSSGFLCKTEHFVLQFVWQT